MATKEWIIAQVSTKGRPCPLLGKRCPGCRDGCAFWVDETIRDGVEVAAVGGCLFAWQYVQANEATLEAIRTQATLQQAGNTVREAVAASARLALDGRAR
jgi:hypothetical protein